MAENSFSFCLHEKGENNVSCDIVFHHQEQGKLILGSDFVVATGHGDDTLRAFCRAYDNLLFWLNVVHVKANSFFDASVREITLAEAE